MCDGFDQPSNVWAFGQAMLLPIINASAPAVLDRRQQRQVRRLADKMIETAKESRITAKDAEAVLQNLLSETGGLECVDSFQAQGGLTKHYNNNPLFKFF